jgi:eukaryotic-like serine/threonine-protein kinase
VTEGTPDHRSDLYGLGASFWRLLAGRRMYTGTVREILDDVVHKDAPPLHVLRPDVPVVLSKIIGKLVQKDPSVGL